MRWSREDAASLDELPQGARVGSASLRREALLRRARPDLQIELLRGNVPTRVAKVESGELDATLLAAAGLKRIGLEDKITALLPLEKFPPACGQGTIAIECRADDARVRDLLAAIDHRDTSLALACERAFLAALDGSCKTPIAGYARHRRTAAALRRNGPLRGRRRIATKPSQSAIRPTPRRSGERRGSTSAARRPPRS